MEDKEYQLFVEKIRKTIDIDLSLYKEAQMNRRIRSLFIKRGMNSYEQYFEALKKDRSLMNEFLDRITINVTEFFRNPSRWEIVQNKVVKELVSQKKKIKCWSAACSTGEEPYTMAMIFHKYLPSIQVEIIATDLDDIVLEKAKAGIFNENTIKTCPKDMLEKYFIKRSDDCYEIKDQIKKMVTFKKHNLLQDKYEKDFDFIACRNVMIYFTEEAKDKMYHKFNEALAKNGVFFVGSTEQIFSPEKYGFEVYDSFFYLKNE